MTKTALDRFVDELLTKPAGRTEPQRVVSPVTLPNPVFHTDAAIWLRQKLATGPQRIGDLMRAWCELVEGHASQDISARIDQLTDARTALDVETFAGDEGKVWW
jgi:hypothetical protein